MFNRILRRTLIIIVLPLVFFSAFASNVTTIIPSDLSYFATGQPNAFPPSQTFKIIFSVAPIGTPAAGDYPATPVLPANTSIEIRFTLSSQGQKQSFLVVFPTNMATNSAPNDLSAFCNAKIVGVSNAGNVSNFKISCIGSQVILSIPNDFMPGGVTDFNAVKFEGWSEVSNASCNKEDSTTSVWLGPNWPAYGSSSYAYSNPDYYKTSQYCAKSSSLTPASGYLMQSTLAQQANASLFPSLPGPPDPGNNPSPLGPLSFTTEDPQYSSDGKTLLLTINMKTYAPQPPPPPPVDPGGGGGGGGGCC